MSDQIQTPQRIDFQATVETLSPLHVGCGQFDDCLNVPGKDGGDAPQVALLCRDEAGAPMVPPTTLKGILRRIAEGLWPDQPDLVSVLFGSLGDPSQQTGRQQGGLTVFMARRTDPIPDAHTLPYFDLAKPGVFVAARTAIDPASGTADDGKLFFQEMVAPHTAFVVRCRLESFAQRPCAYPLDRLQDAVLALFAEMTGPCGIAVGKGQADGLGRLRLRKGSLCLTRWRLDPDGSFVPKKDQKASLPAPRGEAVRDRVTLKMTCDGPFIIMDSSHDSVARKKPDKDTPQIIAQRQNADTPLILGPSLSGALRARALWLDRLAVLNGDVTGGTPDGETAPNGETDRVPRLFGTLDQRALVTIDQITVDRAPLVTQTSLKIDRFSGAPIDGALFATEAFADVCMTVTLSLQDRGVLQPEDQALFSQMIDDLIENGLDLGHGTNKGFGWFTVERIGEAAP